MNSAVFSSLLYGLEHCAIGALDRRHLDGYFLQLAKRVMQLRSDYHLSYAEAEKRLGVDRILLFNLQGTISVGLAMRLGAMTLC